jgi:transposase
MTIPLDLAARIERLFTVEHWRVGTIARQLHVHRDTVRRVLREHDVAPPDVPLRASLVDPYRAFIRETLEKYPTLTASRLHDMVCERGYAGQASHFRHLVSTMRPRPPAEAYLRLRTLPGEQMQVDWAHFDHLQIGRARRPLMGFVMVLSYSRRIFLRFCLNAQMDSFLRGHIEAFAAFGGLARTLLYDNLKSVVLEREGDAIRFNPEFLAFATHYRFEPRPVAVARGNQKGRVERQIEFIRRSFFAGREFTDVADLNAQARQWCEGKAFDRRWPEDDTLSVRQAFEAEQPHLLGLPAAGYALGQRLEVSVAKTPLRALRLERLHGAAYPRATYLVGSGRRTARAHLRRHHRTGQPSAQLRPASDDRGAEPLAGLGRVQAPLARAPRLRRTRPGHPCQH